MLERFRRHDRRFEGLLEGVVADSESSIEGDDGSIIDGSSCATSSASGSGDDAVSIGAMPSNSSTIEL